MMRSEALVLTMMVAIMAAGVVDAAELPLQRVVLFSSGVGYFEHNGVVQGDETVTMSFRVEQINDILKSMVLQDMNGGTIGPVTYAPQDPLERTLQSFAVDISDEPSLGELLSRLRGAQLRVVSAEGTVVGTILGTEWQEKTAGDNVVEFEVLNILTDEGLEQIPLYAIHKAQLTGEDLSSDLRLALEAIAANRDVSKRQVQLHFSGDGQRQVSVGYLLETPVWKTTYRLVADDEKSFLQGWAIVENTTDEDWEQVRMALVSGRPVSFTQNLYQPIYVDRPEVPVQTQVAARPKVYGGALEEAEELEMAAEPVAEAAPRGPAGPRAMLRAAPAADMAAGFGGGLAAEALERGVTAAAAGEEVGAMFHYAITQPVSIDRQQSAMIPIVNTEVEIDRLSIYSREVNPKFPMHGLRLHNTTDLALMGGAITVFEGGSYAGDALMDDLGPGDERLVSYAVDTEVEIAPENTGGQQIRESVKVVNGVLIAQTKQTDEVTYTIKNRADAARTVLIEHPRRDGWELVQPEQAAETTRDQYRLKVEVPAGATEELEVRMEHPVTERIALTSENVDRVTIYMRWDETPDDVKQALQRIVQMKQQIAELERQIQTKQDRLQQIDDEQARIRQNMEQLDHDSELYQQYVAKLTAQEQEFDQVRQEIDGLVKQRNGLQSELESYIANLTVE